MTQDTDGGDSQAAAYAYWSMWKTLLTQCPIENRFDEKIIVTNVNGFTETYAVADLMPFQKTPGGPLGMNLYKSCLDTWDQRQTLNHVPVHIPTLQAVAESAEPRRDRRPGDHAVFREPEIRCQDRRLRPHARTH